MVAKTNPDTCIVDDCAAGGRIKRGYCNLHYWRVRKYGDPLADFTRARKPCSVIECNDLAVAKQLCTMHYQRRATERDLTAPRPKRAPIGASLVRDQDGRKQCLRCKTWKQESDYRNSGDTGDGLTRKCRDCLQQIEQLRHFNLTEPEFEAMLAAQGGVCAICKRDNPAARRWAIDHDHTCCPESGRSCGDCIRGILCGPCNGAIGFMLDDPQRLRDAATYLERTAHVVEVQ